MLQKKDAYDLARMMCEFYLKLARWSKSYYLKNFNINGKGNYAITMRQFQILILLYDLGVETISELSELLAISKSSLSLTISKMVSEGYIRREMPSTTEDGRRVFFYVTEKGLQVLDESKNLMIESLSQYYSTLTEEQKEDLIIGLEKLGNVYSIKEDSM
ncbi:MAG: MarR family transcriptional regulator [Epulopiscium sp.]|nr:MarR family transcriptional regulator [Candidatus Epulonipiscium sp.]